MGTFSGVGVSLAHEHSEINGFVNAFINRDFRYILTEDTYVVWLAGANRFIQFKEPAFFVFEAWTKGEELVGIADKCADRYDLPPGEALRFTNEIISETEKLYSMEHGAWSMEHRAQGTGHRAQGIWLACRLL
jgi:hypothetical protein